MEQMAHNDNTDLTEEHVVEKFLRCMPKRYVQIINLIETLLNFKQLIIEDVTGRLKAVQDHDQALDSEPGTTGGKLLYTMEQWRAFNKKEEGSGLFGSKERHRRPRDGKKKEEKGPRGQVGVDGGATGKRKATQDDGWYLDTGATHHMTGRREFFSDLDFDVKGFIKFGDASAVGIKGVGSVIFKAKTGEYCLVTRVYYIPALKNSIINIRQLDENGSWVEIEDGVLHIWDKGYHLLAKVNRGSNCLYVLHVQVAHPLCLAARRDNEAWRWHERFGHLHFKALKHLDKEMEMVHGMPCVNHVEQLCDTCVVTKLKRRPFPRQASYRATEQLELVHDDLYGPVSPTTPRGRRYFLLLVDDTTRYMWVVLLNSKATAADAVKRH
jgi:hypothetical protein